MKEGSSVSSALFQLVSPEQPATGEEKYRPEESREMSETRSGYWSQLMLESSCFHFTKREADNAILNRYR